MLFLLVLAAIAAAAAQGSIPSPQEVFGFRMGEDRKLIDWTQIVSYFRKTDELSDRVLVREVGKTTLGKPFLLAIISSENNLKNLGRYQEIQKQLTKPHGLEPAEAGRLAAEGKTVVLITLNIHSTEIASSQESVELLHDLATSNATPVRKVLDDVIILLVPSVNPDGHQIVTEWYRKTVGTPAEGSAPPELYHHYAGHDNNRDFFMFNFAESRHIARILYHDWFPEIVLDQHQQRTTGPRLFLPPYEDPYNPNTPPALMAQINLLGSYMVADLHRQGFKGIVTGEVYEAFFMGMMSRTPLWHNRIGILSEMASAHLATPIFVPKTGLSGFGLGLPENKAQLNFLDPWEGGWWRLRDIIDYEKALTASLLDFAALFKERLKMNYYQWNREAIAKGKSEPPFGFLIPAGQHNPSAAAALANTLIMGGVEVQQLNKPLRIGPRTVPAGSFWISMEQSCRAYIKDLLSAQRYPNLKQYPGGPPKRPYDVTAWTLPMQMGVEVLAAGQPVMADAKALHRAVVTAEVERPDEGFYLIERRFTSAFGLAHALLKQHIRVHEATQQIDAGSTCFPLGSFLVSVKDLKHSELKALADEWQVPVRKVPSAVKVQTRSLRKARLGIYQPWLTSMDEGWTRYVFDQFKIEYKSLHNEDLKRKEARLRDSFDAILLPDMSPGLIVDGKSEGSDPARMGTPERPKEYQGGIGSEGVEAIQEFVRSGGTLLCLGAAADFAIEKLRVPAVNVLKGVASKDFYAPGSIFEVQVNPREVLAFGMTENAHIYFTNEPVFRLLPSSQEVKAVAVYGSENPLRSGWLLGEDYLKEKVAMADILVAKGRVILYGFRVQHRAQTHGTYPLLLNATFVAD